MAASSGQQLQYLLKNTNLTIHYITSDPNDQIFALAKEQLRIKPYYSPVYGVTLIRS